MSQIMHLPRTDVLLESVGSSSEQPILRNGILYYDYVDFPESRYRIRRFDLENRAELPEFSIPVQIVDGGVMITLLAGVTDRGCAFIGTQTNNGLHSEFTLLCPDAAPRTIASFTVSPFTLNAGVIGGAFGDFLVWRDPTNANTFHELNVVTGAWQL